MLSMCPASPEFLSNWEHYFYSVREFFLSLSQQPDFYGFQQSQCAQFL